MINISNYIKESLKDKAEAAQWISDTFMDEDTGETFEIMRLLDSKKILDTIEKFHAEEYKIEKEITKLEDEEFETRLSARSDELYDEMDNLEDELDAARRKYNELYIEMEEEVARAADHEKDDVANKYGGELDDLADEKAALNEKINDLRNKIYELEEPAREKSDQYFDKIYELDEKLKKMKASHAATIEKMREDWRKQNPEPTK